VEVFTVSYEGTFVIKNCHCIWNTGIQLTSNSVSVFFTISGFGQAAKYVEFPSYLRSTEFGKHVYCTSLNYVRNSRNNKHNAQISTTVLFIYTGSYMFRQQSAIFRELLHPSELRENTDRYGGLSYNVVKWPV
jgi:hypothetical protein